MENNKKLFHKFDDFNCFSYQTQIENLYNEILNAEDGFYKLKSINALISKKFINDRNKEMGKNSRSFNFEPIGDKSLKFYSRMTNLNYINPNSEIFEDEELKKELQLISSFYYFNLLYLINPSIFYYYDVKNMIGILEKNEEKSYRFYEVLVDIFLEKTEEFNNKLSSHIDGEINKILLKN